MFNRVSEKIVNSFVRNGIVTAEDRELYQYGVKQGLTVALNIATTLVVGLLLNMVWQSALFMLAYIPIRVFAGGYHAKTPLRCYMLSVVMIAVVLLTMQFISFTAFACVSLSVLSALIIVLLSPIEDMNKPLDETETRVYRKRTLAVLVFELLIVIGLITVGLLDIAVCIALALSVLSIMLVAGKAKNSILARNGR